MTDQKPIKEAAGWAACQRALSAAVDAAERLPDGQRALGEALCGALDTVAGGAPRFDAFGNMREDARWWADCATPMELEIYTAAALRRIERATFAHRARKRLFWALWQAMSDKDRTAFLAHAQQEEPPP
ncbi:hypothetical protein KU6B_47920 [Mameliella alba]|uniref:hypothetical protein n=1 Tax=Mameliella alba TaxID=561184 RepID=UPI0013E46386|nr:hypothetical protein [Mameliella alba]BBU58527.1 hypothetical protein KU6B_47920 [Mameliella alba]